MKFREIVCAFNIDIAKGGAAINCYSTGSLSLWPRKLKFSHNFGILMIFILMDNGNR